MKTKCPKCHSKLEVESVGDLVSCPYCLLEFTVDEPKPRRSFRSTISKINWMRWAVVGLTIFLVIIGWGILAVGFWLKTKNPDAFQSFQGLVGGVGGILIGLVCLAFFVLLAVNIILWVFLPLMVYSIKQRLEEAVIELKKITNQDEK